jgi:vacuolar-type H+-ATPase subunit E/Vma4
VDALEKVWEELKKIDAQAEQIRSEAQTDAKEITGLAQKEAEGLLANSKTYAQQEAQQRYEDAVSKSNLLRDEQLEANQKNIENLGKQAQKRMENASSTIVIAVLGEK